MATGSPSPAPAPQPKPVPLRLQRFQKMQALLGPEVGVERIDSYSKWVFGGTAALAALGALYTKQIVGDLNDWGRGAAAAGILCLALAMAASARALAPVMVKYNPNSLDDMERAVDEQFTVRRPIVAFASRALAVALVFFGMAPIIGNVTDTARKRPVTPRASNQVALSYGTSAKPLIDAKLQVAGTAPFRVAELSVERTDSAAVVAQAAAITDSTGAATLALKTDSLPPGVYLLQARYAPAVPDSVSAKTSNVALRKAITIRPAAPPAARPSTPSQRRQR